MTEKFKLRGEFKEWVKKPLKNAVIWSLLTGAALTKFSEAWRKLHIIYGIAATAQLAEDAGVVNQVMSEVEKYNDQNK